MPLLILKIFDTLPFFSRNLLARYWHSATSHQDGNRPSFYFSLSNYSDLFDLLFTGRPLIYYYIFL
jgi:hypothetical protein